MLVVLRRKEQYMLGRTTGITPAVVEVDCMEADKLVHSLEIRWGDRRGSYSRRHQDRVQDYSLACPQFVPVKFSTNLGNVIARV